MVATFWAGEFYGQKSLADRIGAQMAAPLGPITKRCAE